MKRIVEKAKREMTERVSEKTQAVASGAAPNMHEYGKQCGRIEGLKEAIGVIEDILEEYSQTIDLDDF
jgi:hypothetical protein